MKSNIRSFQESITLELDIAKNRVRDLIGPANWGEEGRYKEAILARAIAQFLPSNLKIGTGFILANDDHSFGQDEKISSQLDLIIYEANTPVIFKEGDFVILTESSVRGVVEVKAKLTNYSASNQNSLNKVVEKLNRLKQFSTFSCEGINKKKFVGILSFDYTESFTAPRISEALIASDGLVNHICLGPEKFIRYWSNTEGLHPPIRNYRGRCYIKYGLPNLAFSYFISNLIHIVADEDPTERYWFSFPIEGTKERYRQEPIIPLDT